MADPEKSFADGKSEKQRASITDSSDGPLTGTVHDSNGLVTLGYEPALKRNRSLFTLLFQTLAIAAIPYGEGGPLLSAIYGGGQLSIFLGWIIVCILDECIALSLAEIASRYPTSAGPYYWSFQLASSSKTLLSFITGWIWLIGNLTITLSVNFGFASLIAATVAIARPDVTLEPWQLLLIFYAILLVTFVVCAFANSILPLIDTICAAWTALSILIILIALASTAADGRASPAYALGHYDNTLSGWALPSGDFTFFIGLLPAAYTFSALGMIASMSEEVADPALIMPRAISLCVPVGGIAGLFFIIPICVVLPPLADIIAGAPYSQALPYIFAQAMGTPAGGIGLTVLVLGVVLFCSFSITTAANRTIWAFSRDAAVPGSALWSRVSPAGVPLYSLALLTLVQALLGLINLGSSAAFTAFTSAGVIALAASYGIPIALSMLHARREVADARWRMPPGLGWAVNAVAVAWIAFELVLFSCPTALPVTLVSMNWACVIVVGFMAISALYYWAYARTTYQGPPASDGLAAEKVA